MKFTVERTRFAEAVGWASRSVPSRPISPLLMGMLLEATDAEISLSGFDNEVSSRASIDAEVMGTGRCLVSGKMLAEISRLLPAQPVTVVMEGSKVQVRCGSARFSLPTMAVAEYPALPEVPETAGTLSGDLFATAVAQVALAASRDDSFPVLTGVNVEIEKNTITMVATDRYRLAVRELPWNTQGIEATTALVRGRTLVDAARILAGAEEISLGLTPANTPEQRIGFSADGKVMTSRLLEGAFSAYRHILPTEASTVVTVEVAPFIEAVRRVALVTDQNMPMRAAFKNDTLVLDAGGGESAAAYEEIAIASEGDDITVGLNPTYLAEGLNAMNAPYARLSFTEPKKPVMMSPRASEAGSVDDSYRYLLMPMRLPSMD